MDPHVRRRRLECAAWRARARPGAERRRMGADGREAAVMDGDRYTCTGELVLGAVAPNMLQVTYNRHAPL